MAEKDTTEERRFKKPLPVQVDEKAQLKKSKLAGEADSDLDDLLEKFKAEKKKHKEKIDKKKLELKQLMEDVRGGTEVRQVECVEIKDFSKNKIKIVRTDTQDLVEPERTMTKEEAQRTLGMGSGKKASKNEDDN